MEKPYDLKSLGEIIASEAKKEGLAVAEEALEKLGKAVYLGLKYWATESALLSESKVDDFVAPFYGLMDQFVLPQIAKIDVDGDGK